MLVSSITSRSRPPRLGIHEIIAYYAIDRSIGRRSVRPAPRWRFGNRLATPEPKTARYGQQRQCIKIGADLPFQSNSNHAKSSSVGSPEAGARVLNLAGAPAKIAVLTSRNASAIRKISKGSRRVRPHKAENRLIFRPTRGVCGEPRTLNRPRGSRLRAYGSYARSVESAPLYGRASEKPNTPALSSMDRACSAPGCRTRAFQ